MRKLRHIFLSLALLMVGLLASCTRGTIYSHYEALPLAGWDADSAIVFDFVVADTLTPYDLVLNLLHNDFYPHQNFWVFASFSRLSPLSSASSSASLPTASSSSLLPSDSSALSIIHYPLSISSDTLNYYLADNRGRWLGNGFGSRHDMPMLYKHRFTFPLSGTYRLSIHHGMRTPLLPGVSDLGLTVLPSEE